MGSTMRYNILRILAIVISMLIPFRIALATRLPTDTELHVSYCIPIVAFDVDLYRNGIRLMEEDNKSKEQQDRILKDPTLAKKIENILADLQRYLGDSQSSLRRLQLYIIPRIAELDPVSLLIAKNRAAEDLDRLQRTMPTCEESCIKNQDLSKCINACGERTIPDVRQRFASCRNLSWLPF